MNVKLINVYLIGRIHSKYHRRHEYICKMFDSRFEVFMPHKHNPFNISHKKLSIGVAQIDYNAIKLSDVGLIVEPFGEDCSCEIGYFYGQNKPTILFASKPGKWLNIWMAKYAISSVICDNLKMLNIIESDPILSTKKVIYINDRDQFQSFIFSFVKKYYQCHTDNSNVKKV